MMKATILCEICDEPIVVADLDILTRPLTAGQFTPLGDAYSLPFSEDVSWEWFRCPHCNMRPFVVSEEQIEEFVMGRWPGPETVRTDKGVFVIGTGDYPGVEPFLKVSRDTPDETDLAEEWLERLVAAGVRVIEGDTVDPSTLFEPDTDVQPSVVVRDQARDRPQYGRKHYNKGVRK